MEFAYWAPNLGGLVFSSVDETDWSFASNLAVARAAEQAGFAYTLIAARFILTSGRGEHLESLTTTAAIAAGTERLKLVTAVHPGLWHPGVVAKIGATIDHIAPGRFAVNVVSGWFRREFHAFGEPWLDHDERYRRSAEFIEVLRGLWGTDEFTYRGDFYRINEAWLAPRPATMPEVFQGGNSTAAREMAVRLSDWYFMNGAEPAKVRAQVAEVRELAGAAGRRLRFALNGYVIARETEAEAEAVLDRIMRHANADAVRAFASHAQGAGASTKDRIGMWAQSDLASLVQPNDGLRTGLIGSYAQVAERICELGDAGVDCLLCGFLDMPAEIPAFGEHVIPLVRAAGGPMV